MKLEQLVQIGIYNHAALGGIALIAGTFLLFLKKGTARHKLLGRVFYFAMLISCMLSLVISALPGHHSPFLFSIGIFSIYLILTGKRAVNYRKKTQKDLGVDKAISWVMIVTGIAMIFGYPLYSGSFNVILGVFGLIGLLLSGRDLYLYKDIQELKKRGLRLHIGKMMGGYIAAFTAFFVVNEVLPGMIGWFLPSILGSICIRYFLRKFPVKTGSQVAVWVLLGFISVQSGYAQVYTEKQTRHRFAQLNMGFDYQTHTQGSSVFLNGDGALTSFDLTQTHIPRFVIGGTHFWGHADFSLGYYLHKPDVNVAVNYRAYSHGADTYGVDQFLRRRSFGLEISKVLFDYHGFTPFIGPVVSAEQLRFRETFEELRTQDQEENKLGLGLTFGWDIRPTRLQSWILRTNLRWYPNLNLELENEEKVNFSNLEFNFIQLVVYPGRFF